MKRRFFLSAAALGLGTAALGYGGSLLVCRDGDDRTALLSGLFIALDDMIAPDLIGHTVLTAQGRDALLRRLDARDDLLGLAYLPDATHRRQQLLMLNRTDFAHGRTYRAGRWLVSDSEALLAGIAVS